MYYLSDKQQDAKENLEKSLNRTPRGGFSSKQEFDEYMGILIKQIKKNINRSKAVKEGKISYEEISKKRKEKITKYYNGEPELKAYAIKYYQRYFPSSQKLLQKLTEKSSNRELSQKVILFLKENNIIAQDSVLAMRYAQSMVIMGKNYQKIKTTLRKKLFENHIIEKTIEDIHNSTGEESLLDPESTKRKIKNWYINGKSRYYIYTKIVETDADKELFERLFEEITQEGSVAEDYKGNTFSISEKRKQKLQKEIEKIRKKTDEKQKIIQRLLGKGYSYDEFKDYL